jgi:hypothetical protein
MLTILAKAKSHCQEAIVSPDDTDIPLCKNTVNDHRLDHMLDETRRHYGQ